MASNEVASNNEGKIHLKYWVDDKNRLIMAEAGGDFIDVLFSFLTLPLGAIIRLDLGVELGCIKKLYQSINKLGDDVFWNKICKEMLLSPRNPLEGSCQRLKVKVDDKEATKYYMCHNCSRKGSDLLGSSFCDLKCNCETLMTKEIDMLEEPASDKDNGVFVKGDAKFLIYDDLTVVRSSPSESIIRPLKHGHKEFGTMKEKYLDRDQILTLLKQALTSKSPLSDVLDIQNFKSCCSFLHTGSIDLKDYINCLPTGSSNSKDYIEIKVMVSKSKNEILFVEAGADFVDFLASFLTTPLGCILKLKKCKLSLGNNIRKLYKSAKYLDQSWFIESSKESLLHLVVAPYFGCERNLLNISEGAITEYWYGLGEMKNDKGRIICEKKMISKKQYMLKNPKVIKFLDPRSSDGPRKHDVGFMKRPSLFVVNDKLEVLSMTTDSSTECRFMKDVPLNDLEEHLVQIRKPEALNLLRASLTSNENVFTRSLYLRKWNVERFIPFWGYVKQSKRKRRKREKGKKLHEKKEKRKQEESEVKTRKEKKEINNGKKKEEINNRKEKEEIRKEDEEIKS